MTLYHYACPSIPANASTLPCGTRVPGAAEANCRRAARTVPYANARGLRPVRGGYAMGNPQRDLLAMYPLGGVHCPAARFVNARGGHAPLGKDELAPRELRPATPPGRAARRELWPRAAAAAAPAAPTAAPSADLADEVPLFTMLRRPAQRLLSAFGAGLHARKIGHDANWAMYQLVETPLQFARVPGVAGCQTKALTGRYCAERRPAGSRDDGLLEGDVRRAKQALVERVAFFGITDRWAESIALFHAMTGTHPSGETLRVELGDNRRTPKNGFESKKGPDSSGAGAGVTAGRYDEAALEGFVDEADEDLFAFALRLFEQRLRTHNITCEAVEELQQRAAA